MDRSWWKVHGPRVRWFSGLRFAGFETEWARKLPGRDAPGFSHDPRHLHYGGHSGFQAINLAILFGARRVALLGYDCGARDMNHRHYHGDHGDGLGNPTEDAFETWRETYREAAATLGGVEVINCSRDTTLDAFPRAAPEDIA
jgi:hypothetical protein